MTATTSVSHFRGHLFADLRGSTAFTERAGNAAGADLVRRFRQLVRDEVGGHEGAEVKTEGDAIYVVFPSASTAVMCGLSIIAKAAEASGANPEAPLRVGVGVHAGEAVAVDEGGYIGTAVNLAARVCSVAEAGEVLVTGTVRGIAQASIPVTFVSRGKRRLKGISEPVELYVVVPEGATMPSRRRVDRRVWGVSAAAAGVAVLALVGAAFVLAPRPPAAGASPTAAKRTLVAVVATPTPVPTVLAQVPRVGALAIGQYVTGGFKPPFRFTVSDPGWSLTTDKTDSAGFLYEQDPGGTVEVGRVSKVYLDACSPSGASVTSITSANELVTALRGAPHLTVGETSPINLHGFDGVVVDVDVSEGAFAACDGVAGVAIFPIATDDYVAQPGERFRLQAFDHGNDAVAVVSKSDEGPSVAVPQLEAFFNLAQTFVDSIRFSD